MSDFTAKKLKEARTKAGSAETTAAEARAEDEQGKC